MERVEKALDNEDFVFFLSNTYEYTNGPTRFARLQELLDEVTRRPKHQQKALFWRFLRVFNLYFIELFPLFPKNTLSSFRICIPSLCPLKPERVFFKLSGTTPNAA